MAGAGRLAEAATVVTHPGTCPGIQASGRRELSTEKETGVDDLGDSQPIQVAKADKIKRLLSKAWHREKVKGATI